VITTAVLYICIFLSTAMSAAGYYGAGMINQTFGLVVFGLAWMAGQHKWPWIASLGLAIMTLAAAIGLLYNLPAPMMIGGFLCAFIAWDLSGFNSRVKLAARDDNHGSLTQLHVLRLGLVIVVGFGVVILTRTIRVHFNFEIAALLILAGVWGLSILVGRLRRGE
jgi:phosphoglycerol transferase MdoB-like AlkP superfamily enzyme